ncbi:MAG TPA: dTDP-4-dehydrorhamnose reductase [bacterium]|nr:dTDP-4-dehydrorhamnose reductase [bacterium]
MKVAVIGANGQLGTDLVRALGKAGGFETRPLMHDEIEVADPGSVRTTLTQARPEVVVNCAAFNRVDECEDRPEEAMRVNALGALHVARACADLGALCVYVSTDYVFSGEQRRPYVESDAAGPINVYGASKLAGEQLTVGASPRWLIVRTASLFGTTPARVKGGNFVETMLAKARAGEAIRVVADIRMSPTYAADAASGLARLIRQGVGGTVHLTNAGSCTWYEFARQILTAAGLEANVVPVGSSEYPTKARRPKDSSLASLRADDGVRRCLRPWGEALSAYLADRTMR